MRREVLVTRPAEQAHELCAALARRGVSSVAVPTVSIDRSSTTEQLDALLTGGLSRAAWLVLTSVNGAAALVDRVTATGSEVPTGTKVAAVGPATAATLRSAGIHVDHVPGEYRTSAIAGGLGDVAGREVVLARADAATDELRDALGTLGARVVEVIAYRTVEGPAESRDALRLALRRDLAGVAFASASAVRGLMRLASTTDRHRARALPAFCIGPVTGHVARALGFDVAVVAGEYTAEGLATAVGDHLHESER